MPEPATVAAQVRACQAGDSGAFEPLIARYQNAAYAIALEYLHDPLDAQDAVQDAFVAAYCKLDQLREPAAFSGWFRRLVTTRCQVWLRQQHIRSRHLRTLADDASLSGNVRHNGVLSGEVWRLVDRLPQEMRTTIRLHYLSGFTYAEIAGFLDVPVTTVKGRLQQARLQLRAYMASDPFKEMTMQSIEIRDSVNRIVRQIEAIFEPDVRIFTGEAFFNAVGFDFEHRKEGMLPIRKELRRKVADRLPDDLRQRMRSFFDTHGRGRIGAYGSYALCTSGPPDFMVTIDESTTDPYFAELTKEYTGLSELLAEFYDRAHVESLWEEYRDQIRTRNERNKPFVYQAFDDVISYCRLSRDFFNRELQTLHYTEDPQMCHFTGYFPRINRRMYIIHYWSEEEEGEPGFFYTALLHRVIAPLLERHADLLRRSEALLDISCSRGGNADAKTWPARVQQSFVRTVDRILTGHRHWSPDELRTHMTNEYRQGRILCLYLHEVLKDYEESYVSLEDHFPKLLEGIDIERETARWQDFWTAEAGRS